MSGRWVRAGRRRSKPRYMDLIVRLTKDQVGIGFALAAVIHLLLQVHVWFSYRVVYRWQPQ